MVTSANSSESSPSPPPATWPAVVYFGLVPGLVAILPALVPWLLAAWSGWRATMFGVWLPRVICLIVATVWARQVLVAAIDDLGRRADEGWLAAGRAEQIAQVLTFAVWLTVILMPLSLHRTHATCERLRFRLTSHTALRRLDEAVREKSATWLAASGVGKAIAPNDQRLDPAQFGGPFHPIKQGAIGKLVVDKDQRWFYILDRPREPGPGLSARLANLRRALHAAKGDDRPVLWVYERGLLRVPPGVPRPTATQWGLPIRRLTAVGRGWAWYVAGEPAERAELKR